MQLMMTDMELAPETYLNLYNINASFLLQIHVVATLWSHCNHGLKYVAAYGSCKGESCRSAEETVYNNCTCDKYICSELT